MEKEEELGLFGCKITMMTNGQTGETMMLRLENREETEENPREGPWPNSSLRMPEEEREVGI